MQTPSLFLMLLVAAASFSLNTSLPVVGSEVSIGLVRFLEEGDAYLNKVPPCLENVHKSKIFEYYLQYTAPAK